MAEEENLAPAKADAVVENQAPTQEQITQEKDDALDAGFEAVRGRKTPAQADVGRREKQPEAPKAETPKETKADKGGVATPKGGEVKDEDKPSVIPGYTEKQLKALLAKGPEVETKMTAEIRKLHGKIGEISGLIKQIQTAKPTEQGRKITASALKKLSADYPDLAEALAEDLSGIYAEKQETPEAKPADNSADIDKLVNARLAETAANMQREFQEELLTIRHKDWRKILPTDDFKSWWYSLPEDKRNYYDSPKAEISSEALDAYKAAKESTKKKTTEKKERLEAVITPKTTQAAPPSQNEEDALEAGFRSVRRRRI